MTSRRSVQLPPVQTGQPVLWQTGQTIKMGQLYSYWWNRWNSLSRPDSHSWSRWDSLYTDGTAFIQTGQLCGCVTVSHLYLSLTKHSSLANGTTNVSSTEQTRLYSLSRLPQDRLSRLYRLSRLARHVLDRPAWYSYISQRVVQLLSSAKKCSAHKPCYAPALNIPFINAVKTKCA